MLSLFQVSSKSELCLLPFGVWESIRSALRFPQEAQPVTALEVSEVQDRGPPTMGSFQSLEGKCSPLALRTAAEALAKAPPKGLNRQAGKEVFDSNGEPDMRVVGFGWKFKGVPKGKRHFLWVRNLQKHLDGKDGRSASSVPRITRRAFFGSFLGLVFYWGWVWLVGWLVGWMVGWLDGWMDEWIGWMIGWMVGWFVCVFVWLLRVPFLTFALGKQTKWKTERTPFRSFGVAQEAEKLADAPKRIVEAREAIVEANARKQGPRLYGAVKKPIGCKVCFVYTVFVSPCCFAALMDGGG